MASDLAALLTAVERWQQSTGKGVECDLAQIAIDEFDIAALRASAHQHAEMLRRYIEENVGWDVIIANEDLQEVAAFLDGAGE